jgi:hypothetical protein
MRDERAVIDAMFASLEEANTNRQRLALALPQTLAKAKHQFDCIARQIEGSQRPMASNVVQLRTSDAA